uniref:Uncharacterized protein n=1 Tax=viral metagenome TaxID=1070528 RepID=A0A6C0C683_9ZZZZ
MTRYHGRAKQLTNINRKQHGAKLAGCVSGTGRSIRLARYIKSRVNCNARIGCVDKNGNLTGKKLTYDNKGCSQCVASDGHLLIAKAPTSRANAGGVHRYFPLGRR